MNHLGLFEGIGGFSLAASEVGWTTKAWVEINPFCQKVLKKNFPEAKGYADIKEFDGTKYRGAIDIITGGFPCQPYSLAGKRKGNKDDRHLWPEMLRVIGEIQPRFVVGENVYGLVNWSNGLVFKEVQANLEDIGYEVAPIILPACGINAPHRRNRIWFVAHAYSEGLSFKRKFEGLPKKERQTLPSFERGDFMEQRLRSSISRNDQSIVCRRGHGIPNRVDRIKGLGNAIVPQVAIEIFKAIESLYEQNLPL